MGPEAIVIPIVFLILAAVIAWAISNFSRIRIQEREMLSRERMTAMEKGVNLPLLESPRHRWSGSPLRTGLIMVGIGLGVIFMMVLNGRTNGIGVGTIIVLAGAGNLLYWHLAGKREWETKITSEQQIANAYTTYLTELANKNKNN